MSRAGRRIGWPLVLGWLLLAGAGRAATHHVAPGGDDGGPGSGERPWRTLARAAAAAGPGDTILLDSGVWNERLIPTRSGTAQAVVTFAAAAGATPVIDGKGLNLGGMAGVIQVEGLEWIEVRGLTVRDSGPSENAAGIMVSHGGHVTVRDCRIAHTASSGIGVWWSHDVLVAGNDVEDACHDGAQECISIAGSERFEVAGNVVHDGIVGKRGGEGIDAKHGHSGKVHGNVVHHAGRLGIYVDAWDTRTYDIEVYDNVVHDCHGDGFAVAAEDGGLLERIRVHDNVAYGNDHNGLTVASWGEPVPHHPVRDIRIDHNAFAGNGTSGWGGGILLDNAEAEGIVVEANALSGNRSFQLARGHAPRSDTLKGNVIEGYRGYEGEVKGDAARVWRAPGRATPVNAGMAAEAIQAAVAAAGRGNTVVFAPGAYDFGKAPLRGADDVCLYFAGTATITGGIDLAGRTGCRLYGRAPGAGPVFSAPVDLDGTTRCEVANAAWRGTPSTGYPGSALRVSNMREGKVVNCDFTDCDGGLVTGWGADRCLFEGNHFTDFQQGISLHWTDTNTEGRDIVIRRNWFTGARRVPIEMGPGGAQRTTGMLVEWNYFDEFNNQGEKQWGTLMAISFVAQGARDSICRYNACRKGPKPPAWTSCIGIEWTGSGECYGNWVFDFTPGWAFMMYASGWNVHDNVEVDCPWPDLNNGKGTGTFGPELRAGEFPDARRDPRFARRPYPI